MHVLERILVRFDVPPWSWLLRAFLGIAIFPLYSLLCQNRCPAWMIYGFFAFVLVALRIVPIVFRKVFPFSKETVDVWYTRRQLAKTYDSYQWQKLFWMGLGMSLFLVLSKNDSRPFLVLAGFCLVAGLLGLICWCVADAGRRAALRNANQVPKRSGSAVIALI